MRKKYFHIKFIRHGPKDLGTAHNTWSEALLTSGADREIEKWAEENLKKIKDYKKTLIISSPVTRSIQTAEIIAEYLLDKNVEYVIRKIDPHFSSYDLKDEEVLNLNPNEMSQLWKDAKDADNNTQKEDRSLFSWTEVGFKKRWTHSSMTQEEIAERIFSAISSLIVEIRSKNVYVIIIGHSGDIEPFLYYTLSLLEEANREDETYMTQKFFETGGALSPLEGITFRQQEDEIILTYPTADKKTSELKVTKLFS